MRALSALTDSDDEINLNDNTIVNGISWFVLKDYVMDQDFPSKNWYRDLTLHQ